MMAIEEHKRVWRLLTFSDTKLRLLDPQQSENEVESIINEFGPKYMKLAC